MTSSAAVDLSSPASSRVVDPYLRSGLICAVAAHTMWGLLPLYWRLLNTVPSIQLVCHRIIWSSLLLLIVVPLMVRRGKQGGSSQFFSSLRSRRVWVIYGVAAALISLNWLAFIWAVNHDRVLEASLGYYINPLLNVLIGVVFLKERLWPAQWAAVGIAAVGVGVMAVAGGGLPWVALVMASSFAVYGLVKKKAPLPSLTGLMLETVILLFPALAFVGFAEIQGVGAFGNQGLAADALMITGGFVTVVPLALFAIAARRVPLSTIGVLQYVGPTLQFFVGAVLLGEPFEGGRIIGFACVWAGLLLYLLSLRQHRQRRPLPDLEEAFAAVEPEAAVKVAGAAHVNPNARAADSLVRAAN